MSPVITPYRVRNASFRNVVLILTTALLILSFQAGAQWSHDFFLNNPIAKISGEQYLSRIVSDGAGGGIVVWEDARSGNKDIYAQRIDSLGFLQWTINGVPICTQTSEQAQPVIVGDGSGGAIIAWVDSRPGATSDIYAQRINSSGVVQWAANGVAVCAATNDQYYPMIVGDGSGGAIVSWGDNRSGGADLYAQRLNAGGATLWTANGVAICTATNYQGLQHMTSDGAGGAVMAWQDLRGGGTYDIYAQRINSTGTAQWTANGVPVCTSANSQSLPRITGDGSGFSIITWEDRRTDAQGDVYAQMLNSAGTRLWTTNGVVVSNATNAQLNPGILTDGGGGAFIVWHDYRSGSKYEGYAQRVNSAGAGMWVADGIKISTNFLGYEFPELVPDGSGGFIDACADYDAETYFDVFAQRVAPDGRRLWGSGGVTVSTAASSQGYPGLAGDGAGGAIVAWGDYRSGVDDDIYAQKIDQFGFPGINSPSLVDVRDVPADQGGFVTITWDKAPLDKIPGQTVINYTIWRGIDAAVPPGSAAAGYASDETAARRVTVNGGQPTYWELIGTVPGHNFDGYSFTAPTPSDSSGSGTSLYKFLVSAETWNIEIFWDSNVDSGYSVDNLSPAGVAPVAAVVQAGPAVDVHWTPNTTDPDVKLYEVHRSLTDGFTPDGSTKIGQTADTLYTDASPVVGVLNYYRIVTVDLHDNRSLPSAQAPAAVGSTQLYGVQDKWNMVSVPLTLGDYTKTVVYATAVSNAFYFNGMYTAAAVLANGPGYWVKFSGAQSVPMTGLARDVDSFTVIAGWNMVGSVSGAVDVGTITSNPPGLVTSNFFAYTPGVGYSATSTIDPGMAYWVKVTGGGTLTLDATGAVPTTGRIRIVPTGEMPPPPPGEELAGGLPADYRLEQNYPNPFNPVTEIRYALPLAGYVRMTVYNVLGEEVARLVDGYQEAGERSVAFDGGFLPSGIYACRIESGDFRATRKMVLLR